MQSPDDRRALFKSWKAENAKNYGDGTQEVREHVCLCAASAVRSAPISDRSEVALSTCTFIPLAHAQDNARFKAWSQNLADMVAWNSQSDVKFLKVGSQLPGRLPRTAACCVPLAAQEHAPP